MGGLQYHCTHFEKAERTSRWSVSQHVVTVVVGRTPGRLVRLRMELLPTDPRRGTSEALEAWMAEAIQSEIEQLARFARRRQDDLRASKAGLTLEWSHGVTEGHIHCLRLVKRRGHGRVGFVLSRQCILRAAQRRNVARYI
jgi:hypothetical protein